MNHLSTPVTTPAPDPALPREYLATLNQVGYRPIDETTPETYAGLGFKSGLEIHQQLLTEKKLFCHCPAGLYQHGEYDAEIIRHMRPTLSEMGEYDGTALMEKKTRKTIIYRIKNETACTYDVDDTPPFKIDRQALNIALEIALMLGCSLVGEFHIARKQYLDGSIPTGFQRTGIVGIEGKIPLKNKNIRIIQLSIEEDSCREVSDIGHNRVYTTDRLGVPLIESVTYPEMLTPDEVAEAAQYLRLLVRTSGKVRTGIGAARQDVNVSIEGGTRVEIKGVAHIKWIPNLTHIEAFRQKALLAIRDELCHRVMDQDGWHLNSLRIDRNQFASLSETSAKLARPEDVLVAVNLPAFDGLLSHFTQPGQCFVNEISNRLKVIACIEKPHLVHSEGVDWLDEPDANRLAQSLSAAEGDAQLIFWGPADDVPTALETIEERCRLAFDGVPNETRKSFADGSTIFERVLPGPDRMYPDTDSAPIAIGNDLIERLREKLCTALPDWLNKLRNWSVPEDTYQYLINSRLVPVVETVAAKTGWPEKFVAMLFGHTIKGALRCRPDAERPDLQTLADFCIEIATSGYDKMVARDIMRELKTGGELKPGDLIGRVITGAKLLDEAILMVPELSAEFDRVAGSNLPRSKIRWIVGRLRRVVSGEVNPARLASRVAEELYHE